MSPAASVRLEVYPMTLARWPDLQTLFGAHGAYGGCWCMWWRLTRSEFSRTSGEQKKEALQGIIEKGEVPGLIAYIDGQPAAWCSIGPRENYPALERSRTLKRIDQEPVWSIVCFFTARPFRRQGLTVRLLQAAVQYAQQHGAKIVEAYPVEIRARSYSNVDLFMGAASAFRKAGFMTVKSRPLIMRYFIGPRTRSKPPR